MAKQRKRAPKLRMRWSNPHGDWIPDTRMPDRPQPRQRPQANWVM